MYLHNGVKCILYLFWAKLEKIVPSLKFYDVFSKARKRKITEELRVRMLLIAVVGVSAKDGKM